MEHRSRARDRHLGRVTRITRWLVVASAGATGLFALLLARPQTSTATTGTADSGASPSTSVEGSRSATSSRSSSSSARLEAPSRVPSRSSARPRASSGGS